MKHHLRISLKPFVFALVAFLFVSSAAFAGEPVPGVGVGAGKNPGGQITMTKTGTDGKFIFPQSDSGSYTISFPNDSALMPFNVQFDKGFKVIVKGKQWLSSRYHTLPVRPGDKIIVIATGHTITIGGKITKLDTTNK